RPTTATMETPADVLCAGEVMRHRLWVTLCAFFALAGLLSAALLTSPGPGLRLWLAGGSALLLVASLLERRAAPARRELHERPGLHCYLSVLAALPAYAFFGWASAVLLLAALGGFIYAMGYTRPVAMSMAVVMMVTHALIATLAMAGVLDRGITRLDVGGVGPQVACLLAIDALLALAFLAGQQLRAQAFRSVEQYDAAVRDRLRRESQLAEIVHELQHARQAGKTGHFSGHRIGSFDLGELLGRGAMGDVYDATHLQTGAPSAVKVIRRGAAMDVYTRRRFEQEIALAATVESPHVVRVLEHSVPGAEILYLAMERLEGELLADVLGAVERPLLGDLIDMLHQVARGLSAIHAAGVVHRDLKPRNVFRHVLPDGRAVWKVLDFGVSKLLGAATLTGAHDLIGTPNYMSPEQALGRDIDPRSDVFALGCIAYRCLTGRQAFAGRDIPDIVYQVGYVMPARPSLLAALPGEVDRILAIALAKDRDHRFDDPTTLVAALTAACHASIDDDLDRRGSALIALQPWRETLLFSYPD
ncbi:MAG TPA: serine/threonine-protein kinase, partial [Kofleriaceae bacterium]|nr:serine/threonine-protein kinase [Kofleriaceae bacterium]